MKDIREELWPDFEEGGLDREAFDRTYDVYVDMEMRVAQLEAICLQHGLTLKEWRILSCSLEGQMTDAEICEDLFLNQGELNELVEGLKSRSLIGRTDGRLVRKLSRTRIELMPFANRNRT
jgi:DNA-binding MarR family transcriptional regulator